MKRKRIKVLHFPIRNSNGGVTRSALKFWKYIDHDRFQFDFATCSPRLDFEQDIINQGCGVHYISCYAEQDAEQFCKELRGILLQGYDAIHLNTSWWKSFYAEKVAREIEIKKIIVHARSTSVDITDREQREKELQIHEKYKNEFTEDLATHFLACSTEAADFMFGTQISRDKIRIFHNALDIERYGYDENKRTEIRRRIGVESKFVLGTVGRMGYAKNHKFLIDCFYEIQKKIENAILLLVGNGELEDDIHKQIKKYHICNKVIFIGAVNNTEDYLQAMDVFALPSRFEGLPNVLIEAQTAGLRCIASNFVTREAKITDNVIFLELKKDKWVDEIMRYVKGYDRCKVDEQIRSAGYDIREEIKILEGIYSGDI
ncbi:MAG: glycosyltransferase family 1 protein [Lachnospiraceae bacterium]|nr:glycosyltransferase family 1 protein [Lachnospiraceae bacterium]